MKHSICVLLLLASLSATAVSAQTAKFAWNGSTDSSQLVELSTIGGQPVNQSTGYAGAIQIVNGNFLGLLELPESLGFPNNGYLDCETAITWGAKQWGTRSDGTTMNGTQAGDYYYLPASTSCPLWNGTALINITEFREFIAHRYCRYSVCKTFLTDTMENGFGTATVE